MYKKEEIRTGRGDMQKWKLTANQPHAQRTEWETKMTEANRKTKKENRLGNQKDEGEEKTEKEKRKGNGMKIKRRRQIKTQKNKNKKKNNGYDQDEIR